MYWKKTFEETGMGGLKTGTKSGRPSLKNENIRDEIRTELSCRDHWKAMEISKIIEKKSGVRYTRRHIRRMAQEWGYALIMPRKKHKNSATDEEVEQFNKKAAKILGSLRKGMTAVCMDESVFI